MARAFSPAELIGTERHLFIEASAGSGKTTLMVELIAEIIRTRRAEIQEILCVTFTEKAASELKAKVYKRLTADAGLNDEIQKAIRNFSRNAIGTIHSFCLKMLKNDPRNVPVPASAEMNDDDIFEEAREWVYRMIWPEFLPEVLEQYLNSLDFGKGGKSRALDSELRKKATYLFAVPSTQITPQVTQISEVRTAAEFKAFTLFKISERMNEIADAQHSLTYSRMITGVADAVMTAEFADRLRNQFKYALIDEFQDTDPTQWLIFETLFMKKPGRRLLVVGDPKQAIYKFRGADVFVYLKAREVFRLQGAHFETLRKNYRSTNRILDVLDEIFLQNVVLDTWGNADIHYETPERGVQVSENEIETGVDFYFTEQHQTDAEDKFAEVTADLLVDIQARHPEWRIAIVAFKHATLRRFADALTSKRINFGYYKQKPDYGRLEFTHLRKFLETFSQPVDEGLVNAQKTIFLKNRQDGAVYYRQLADTLANNKIFTFLNRLHLDLNPLHLLLSARDDIMTYHSWRVLFQYLMDLTGKRIFDLNSLLNVLNELSEAAQHEDESVGDMLRPENAVTLITVQSAKGLDWDMVVVGDGRHEKTWKDFAFFHDKDSRAVVPADEAAFDAGNDKLLSTDDEARITQLNLLYVALTRARFKMLACISGNSKGQNPGPVAHFLLSSLDPARRSKSSAQFYDLNAAHTSLDHNRTAPEDNFPIPQEVATLDIANRISERTSFTGLMRGAENTAAPSPEADPETGEYTYIADILPRGADTGQLLHKFLEFCDFATLIPEAGKYDTGMKGEILTEVNKNFPMAQDSAPQLTERIFEILEATASAALPLIGGGHTTLAKLNPENLWREMPFWSAARVHKVLGKTAEPVTSHRIMHGFMDLIFTPDGSDFYILDYKSNSLADIDPATIDDYTREHYGLQAEIYSEALRAYLSQNYPGQNKRVAGCYFLFLRYLKSGQSEGVHFMDLTHD